MERKRFGRALAFVTSALAIALIASGCGAAPTAAPTAGTSLVASYIENRLDEINYAFNRNVGATETLMPRALPSSLLALNASGVLPRSLFLETQFSRRRFTIEQGGPDFSDRIRGTSIIDSTNVLFYGAPRFSGQPPNDYDNDAWSLKGSYLLSTRLLGNHDLRVGYDYFRESSLEENEFSRSGFVIAETRSIIRGTQVFPSFANTGSTQIILYQVLAPAARTSQGMAHATCRTSRVRRTARGTSRNDA